ncbi:MAG: Omp28-related outer membrane protein [Chitinophagales bacterium]|nr:Omp28-related outer membrane protein [Chitinophagales bacterium]
MKRNKFLYFAMAMVVSSLFSCKEEGPFINFEEGQNTLVDTSYLSTTPIPSQNKNVLFEEFSGVRCSNCPAGNAATNSIYAANPGRVVPVTIHSDFLGFPYENDQDLRNDEANEIANSLGPVGQKPAAFVNRKVINGLRLLGSISTWSAEVANELAQSSFVNMNLEVVSSDLTERSLRYRITLSYSAAADHHNLGFFLTESEIETDQLDGSVHVTGYIHEFVLRKAITPIIGEDLANSVEQNTVIVKEFEIDLDDFDSEKIWDMSHMYLVAFIRLDNDNIENAAMVKILP